MSLFQLKNPPNCKVLINTEILPSWFFTLSLMLMKILKPCTVATQNSADL